MPVSPSPPPATAISDVLPDVMESHILTRLDGTSLACTACSSASLRRLSDRDRLWADLCRSTWPSTASPRVRHVVSCFPGSGPRAFFSSSYPLPSSAQSGNPGRPSRPPSELISAVDIFYRRELIFSKVEETETVTGWFRCSPFRVDLLDPKDVVPTQTRLPDGDDACTALIDDMTLSWILIDPIERRAVNLSSQKPVSVQRHWLSGEVQVRFSSILAVGSSSSPSPSSDPVQCSIVVNCGGSEGGEMQVREVSLEVEDMDGKHLNGRDSLVILQAALEGKKGNGVNRAATARRRHREFLAMKRERRERKLRSERTLDTLCVAFGASIFAAFWFFLLS